MVDILVTRVLLEAYTLARCSITSSVEEKDLGDDMKQAAAFNDLMSFEEEFIS